MTAQTRSISAVDFSNYGTVVTSEHFGANYLAILDNVVADGESQSDYEVAADLLGVKTYRYPGGTMAEEFFDIGDKQHFVDNHGVPINSSNLIDGQEQESLINLFDFLDFVSKQVGKATIVIPVTRFAEAIEGGDPLEVRQVEKIVKNFIRKCLSLETFDLISAFEIGNEFPAWMSTETYAKLAINFSVWIGEVFTQKGVLDAPDILIQTPFVQYGDKGVNNFVRDILELASGDDAAGIESVEDAVSEVDGFIIHSYTGESWLEEGTDGQSAVESNFEIASILQEAFWGLAIDAGIDIKNYSNAVTEWNTRNSGIREANMDDMAIAMSLLDHFNQLVQLGADVMSVWPIIHNTLNSLTDLNGNDEVALNPIGAVFALLQENTIGTHVVKMDSSVSIDRDADSELLMHVFQGEEETIIYVSNISGESISTSLTLSGFELTGATLSMTQLTDELGSFASATSEIDNTAYINGELAISLPENSISQFVFTHLGVSGTSSIKSKSETHDPNDHNIVIGSGKKDEITGTNENDEIRGRGGKDTIFGASGEDILKGGKGKDKILGGSEKDLIKGGSGRDKLYGNEGKDTIIGGDGADILNGGKGKDTFIFEDGWGKDRVVGFYTGDAHDLIDLTESSEITSYVDLMNNHVRETSAGVVIDDGQQNSILLQGVGMDELHTDFFAF